MDFLKRLPPLGVDVCIVSLMVLLDIQSVYANDISVI